MPAPSCLPPFDSLAAQTGMFELSNILTHVRWLEFFIRLIPMEKLRTELYLLHFVLKGRVYLGDIWQIVGGRMLEAQREESLRSTVEDHSNRWSIERDFMEEKRDRCQLEVSLCSQAIDHVEQRWAMRKRLTCRCVLLRWQSTTLPISQRLHDSVIEPVATYSVAARTKCETWLRRQTTDPIPPKSITLIETSLPLFSSPSAIGQFALAHLEQRMQVTVNSDDPSFSLRSTWVTRCLQEAFQKARQVELSTQTGLMSSYLDVGGYHMHHRSTQSELIFLRATMRRAQAEAAVYTLALENSPASTYSDSDSDSSPRPTLPQHLPEEVRRYMDYIDTVSINSHTDTDLL
ncbi:uncharacterized protein HD556DRAFT_1442012 [Suillus plorans]|uniref:Uncharacterized protein n=1 Tax=Suillus plorans TaxID=116603 RepID=A0A9P7ASX9_9AGAM|nr:uncharacterized protein HD556DRAFT_1442012 [Suillus plorans]KAG1795686.1 hypothetical protein HD556DRAFT_1442012 [Suillus plorans]